MKHQKIFKIIWLLASLAVLLVVVGFWFDTDAKATILSKYSPKTMLKIGLITVSGYLSILLLRFILFKQEFVSNGKRRVIPFRNKFFITIALFIVGFVIVEGILQWSQKKDRQERFAGYDPFLQVVPKPNDKKLHINRWGFRGEEIERIKPFGTYRIFVVGGSTVYSKRVDYELSHPRVLEKELGHRYPTLKIEVQNAGMDWHTSQHSLMKILFNIQDFKPDMIIIYHAINDLFRSFNPKNYARHPYQNDYSHYFGDFDPFVW